MKQILNLSRERDSGTRRTLTGDDFLGSDENKYSRGRKSADLLNASAKVKSNSDEMRKKENPTGGDREAVGAKKPFNSTYSDLPDARIKDAQFPRLLDPLFMFYRSGGLEILRRDARKFKHRRIFFREIIRKARYTFLVTAARLCTRRRARIYIYIYISGLSGRNSAYRT